MKKYATGVLSIHSISPEMLSELWDNGIDLYYEEALNEFLAENPNSESYDFEWTDNGDSEILIGFRFEDGEYDVDSTAEISAIISSSFSTIQIIKSNYHAKCNKCSPCFPYQGDLDTPGNDYDCYTLPLEYFDIDNPPACKPRRIR